MSKNNDDLSPVKDKDANKIWAIPLSVTDSFDSDAIGPRRLICLRSFEPRTGRCASGGGEKIVEIDRIEG